MFNNVFDTSLRMESILVIHNFTVPVVQPENFAEEAANTEINSEPIEEPESQKCNAEEAANTEVSDGSVNEPNYSKCDTKLIKLFSNYEYIYGILYCVGL